MMLPHLLEREDYTNYFKGLEGWKILDNGANEEVSYPIEDFVMLANKHKVNEIVLPDTPFDRVTTIKQVEDFLVHPASELWNGSIMAVVQGRTYTDYYDCIDFYMREDRISCIGIPRLTASSTGDERIRLKLAQYIGTRKAIHCLGAHAWVEEVQFLFTQGIVRGIDTSLPFVLAKSLKTINLHGVTQYISRGRDHSKFFLEQLSAEQYSLSERNALKYLALAGIG